MFKISVANEKGGVAKTTSATSLAAALAEQHYRVLLFDLDTQANSTLSIGLDPKQIEHSIFSSFINKRPLSDSILPTNCQNVWIMPSNFEVGLIEQNLPRFEHYESRLKNLMHDLENSYDYVIFDCPPFLGSVTLNALTASDFVLIPTQTEFFSIYSLKNLLELVRQVRAKYNPQLYYRMLVTMYDRRNRIHQLFLQKLQDEFSMGMMQTIIETDTRLRECAYKGITIFQYAPTTRAACQFRALAQEIIEFREEHHH